MRRILTAALAATAFTAAACDDPDAAPARMLASIAADSGTDTTGGGPPGVTVTPASDTVTVGDTAAFTATLRDAQGNVVPHAHIRWRIGDPTVASIQQNFGDAIIVRALRRGGTTITAATRGQSGTAVLVVRDSTPPPPPDSVATVTVTPDTARVPVGDSATFFALLRDARGDTLSGRPVGWTVSDSTVARIEGVFGQTVILRAQRRGSTVVTATSEGKSGSGILIVSDSTPPPPPPDSVATVTVTPDTAQVAAGDTTSFFATLRDANGNILSGRPVAWSVSDSTVAQIEGASGSSVVVRALRSGASLVTATSEGKSGAGRLVVR